MTGRAQGPKTAFRTGREKRSKQQPRKYPAPLSSSRPLLHSPSSLTPPLPVSTAQQGPELDAIPREARPRHDFHASVKSPAPRQGNGAVQLVLPRPPPPPAASLACPRRHSLPSLCPRLANHQAIRAGTGIIDRKHQPIIARQRAVPCTRALLTEATGRPEDTVGARGAAGGGGLVASAAKAVGTSRAGGALWPLWGRWQRRRLAPLLREVGRGPAAAAGC